jgi:predicted permease
VRRGWAYDVEFITRLAMTLSIPCLIFMARLRSDVDPRLLRDTVLAALAAYAAVGGVVWGLVRRLGLDMATYWAPITFGNAGNLGLPVALFAVREPLVWGTVAGRRSCFSAGGCRSGSGTRSTSWGRWRFR